jgi:hypothetical protein
VDYGDEGYRDTKELQKKLHGPRSLGKQLLIRQLPATQKNRLVQAVVLFLKRACSNSRTGD